MPYKSLLLAALLDQIRAGRVPTRQVRLVDALISVYYQLLATMFPHWPWQGDPGQPFRHLHTDGILELEPRKGATQTLQQLLGGRAKWPAILDVADGAVMEAEVHARLATDSDSRQRLLLVLEGQLAMAGAVVSLGEALGTPRQVESAPPKTRLPEIELERALVRGWQASAFGRMGVSLYKNAFGNEVGQQFRTDAGIIDLLGWQEAARQWWVIELKRDTADDKVVGQVSRYLGYVGGRMGRDGDAVHGAIVAKGVSSNLRYAVESLGDRISLWSIDDRGSVQQVAD